MKKTSSTLPALSFEIDRRAVVASGLTLVAAAALTSFAGIPDAKADDISIDELMKSGGLDDIGQGSADAKVTVIEYASMSCGHCAHFHETVFPKFKEKYIDSGKIHFIFREFPLDNRAAAASMLARCVGGDKTFPMIQVLFEEQKDWAYVKGSPVPKLFEIAKQVGFTEESFNKCLEDGELLKKITDGRERAATVFGVNSTPTFFINGQRLKGGATLEDFEKIIDPLLAKS